MNQDRLHQRDDFASHAIPAGVKTTLVILAGLVALWFCVRAMLFHMWQEKYPLIGQAISPPSPVSEALISLNRASTQNGLADPLARRLLQDSLRRGPLLANPFIVAGLDASARNAFGSAVRLMEEARRRDPRAIIPRYWLFDNYLRDGDYARGIAEAGPLMRLQPAAEPAVLAVLTALIQVPQARPALIAALRKHPSWSGAFFRQAAAAPALHEDGASLSNLVSPNGQEMARNRQTTVRDLAAAGHYVDAYAMWLGTLPPNERPDHPGLFDGGFGGQLGGAPFGWQFGASDGAAQVIAARDAPSGAGLAIRAAGDRTMVVAEQLVRVTPGALRLRFSTRSLEQSESSNAGLEAELRCGIKGGALAGEIVETFGPRLEPHTVSVVPKKDCGAVLVRFSVVPGIEAGSLQALLTNISLSQDASAQAR